MKISIDIAGFRDIGTNNIVIYKVFNTDNDITSYYVIHENDFASPTYYKIVNSDEKINRLMIELKNTGSIIKFNDQDSRYELLGYKVYDIISENRRKSEYVVDIFDSYPINEEITFNDFEDNNVKEVSYDQYFHIHMENNDGFPVV